jgi:AcrR family transcriptional regulator
VGSKKTKRRSADEAQKRILDAAEKRLVEAGPAAIRLQDVAADVGVSHPAILHHFKSREGLVQAVAERAMRALEADLITSFTSTTGAPPNGAEMLEKVWRTLARGGHARLLSWLLLSGYAAFDVKAARASWKAMADATHSLRGRKTRTKPTYEDTLFTISLAALAMFGEAIAGEAVFKMAGLDHDKHADKRFRAWLASLLATHLSHFA